MNPNPTEALPASESQQDKIREAAYFQWLERGCSHGDDWAHWFAAESRLLAGAEPPPAEPAARAAGATGYALQASFAAHSDDPAHRFHQPGTSHDDRRDIIASGAIQRVRGRHFGGSLRPQQKKAK